MVRILIGGPVYQKPDILALFLRSLERLVKADVAADYLFIDDNKDPASSAALKAFQAENKGVTVFPSGEAELFYHCDQEEHHWNTSLTQKVAAFKDKIFQHALESDYTHVFLVDSDLVLHPNLLAHLLAADKDIISEIFWTRWRYDQEPLPNVWLYDVYDLCPRAFDEVLAPEEEAIRARDFLTLLRMPGVYEVGGLGACTLISRKALEAGMSFAPVKNLMFVGEDRHFCVRASVLGFNLFVDTHFPAFHIYRETDLTDAIRYFLKTERKADEAEPEAP